MGTWDAELKCQDAEDATVALLLNQELQLQLHAVVG